MSPSTGPSPPGRKLVESHQRQRRCLHAPPNGAARYQREKVRVAIVGVGNCASAFVQGVQYYRDADPNEDVPG